jgi:hypothetical protein
MQEAINYSIVRNHEKKVFEKMIWIMLPFAAIFVYVMIRFALSGGEETLITSEITSNGVYDIAQDFVRPTLNGFGVKFSSEGFQYGKLHDSVYMIRSYVDTKNADNQEVETKFEITLKYHGGMSTDQSNWEVIKLYKEDE